MVQSREELESWYASEDPWSYETEPQDETRKAILLSELPKRDYKSVLDIGCGEGYITRDLPGDKVLGVDLSQLAISRAQNRSSSRLSFKAMSLFDLADNLNQKFDLIVITGVLYPQYIGQSSTLVNLIIDKLLEEDGILVSVHIKDWYRARFPYLKLKTLTYDYRDYEHLLEIYVK